MDTWRSESALHGLSVHPSKEGELGPGQDFCIEVSKLDLEPKNRGLPQKCSDSLFGFGDGFGREAARTLPVRPSGACASRPQRLLFSPGGPWKPLERALEAAWFHVAFQGFSELA